MSSFPFPSTGDNPFAFYRSVLRAHSIHLPDDPAGFRARLIVLFIVVACLFLTSLLNFALHILSYRIKGRSIWLFRLVERDGSKRILSNHFALCGIGGAVMFAILFGDCLALWRTYVSPGNGDGIRHVAIWGFAVWPPAYAVGWTLSWATFQAYGQVASASASLHPAGVDAKGRGWRAGMPAWLENLLFVGGGIGAVATHSTLAGIASEASNDLWHTFDVFDGYLASQASSWDGSTLSATAGSQILKGFSEMEKAADHFYYTSANMCIGAAVLPLFLVLVNLVLASFVLTIRQNIRLQLVHFPTLTASDAVPTNVAVSPPADGEKPNQRDPLPSPTSPTFLLPRSSPTLPPSSVPFSPPTPILSPSSPRMVLSISIDPQTNTSLRTTRPLPTRSHVRAIADDPELAVAGSSSHLYADRISALMKAEIELLVIGVSVIVGALALAVTCAWSVTVFRDWENMSWAKQEAVLTLPIWVLGIGLVVGEGAHAWVEWKYVVGRWWRIEQYAQSKERRESDLAAKPASATGGGSRRFSIRSFGIRPPFGRSTTTDSTRSARGVGGGRTSQVGGGGFDGAIEVAIEVMQKEEVDVEVEDEEEAVDELLYSEARRAAREGEKLEQPRRKEVWED
ncbi:hypothetical protein NBRC10512_001851 [Rhodotorula toruloides]|uniref:RHTO0S19e01200g1_1 n=2 Tax=Rhodotorula toruloides TaxID=5286 RepID=A0A061BF83_RHOTO|nr:uncharacterized protein RHTO_03713 [Rhodotorula toruloides NP11]EMS20179.1 hypothetical protein RHTO_03713 [Rhodotorula toruloides NP11]CDR48633.1 RHTO0S19e01200g1_1 [Rhodotorula toruloides]